ncbi:MAG TPA: UDP-N-acetylmuramoyl-L-alanine--D-glutamate ligase [Actinomycetota bacterium]|nr:UDP-N-acetylmuramoyl-L-alanine--D-glutamate ligase [Actinomycetota bacterium]
MSGAFAGERAVVLGMGVAGTAAAEALAEEGADVRVSEIREDVEVPPELRALGVRPLGGGHRPEHLEGATLVVASPGIPPHAPVMGWARERALPIWGELELGARLARSPYVAVTGTNGKTTTTGMIAACLRAGGLDAVACGNIGYPFPTAARRRHDILVVEASSFQLELQESFHPRVSVLLNVAPDHLDWHGSFEAYGAAKARVFMNQTTDDVHVANRDDAAAAAISSTASCAVAWFSAGVPAAGEVGWMEGDLSDGSRRLGSPILRSAGQRSDAAAAASVCLALEVDDRSIAAGLEAYAPEPHRGDVIATVDGVQFVDDSKATNPHAAIAAVGDLVDVVLIAGGRAKGVDLGPLGGLASRLTGVVAIGEAADEVVGIFEGAVTARKAGSIEEAVGTGFELSRRGGTVLLAPACASWDMFRDYRERGERFATAVRALEREVGGP